MGRCLSALFFALLFFFKFISSVFSTCVLSKRDPLHLKSTLNLSLRSDPLTLDPRKNSDGVTSQFLMFLYEGLTEIGEDKQVKMAIASNIEASKDFTEYLITIKRLFWSNGEVLTAHDFKRSWLEILSPAFGAYNPDYFFNIKNAKAIYLQDKLPEEFGVEVLDEKTFKVLLERPDPYFPELLSNKHFFPVHPSVSYAKSPNQLLVFPGPFCIEKWLHQNKIDLKLNLFHRNYENARIDLVEFMILEEEHLQLDLFEQGKLDWIGAPFSTLSLDAMQYLRQHPCFRVFETPSLYYFTLNLDVYPLQHQKLRKALALAIDRQSLIQDVLGGQELPAFAFLPPQMHALSRSYFQEDLLLAKELLAQALEDLHLSLDTFPTITLKYPSLQLSHLIAQAVQQQWKQHLGIHVHLQNSHWHGFLSDLQHKKYHIAALGKGTHVLDPYYFLVPYHRKNQPMNRCGYENVLFAKVLDQLKHEPSAQRRLELVETAESVLMEDMPMIPLFFQKNYCLVNKKLKNIQISPLGQVRLSESYFD